MKKISLGLILFHSACTGMDQDAPSITNTLSPLATQIINKGIKPLKIWPSGDVDFPNGVAITKNGEMWHHRFVMGLGSVYLGVIEEERRLSILKSFDQKDSSS